MCKQFNGTKKSKSITSKPKKKRKKERNIRNTLMKEWQLILQFQKSQVRSLPKITIKDFPSHKGRKSGIFIP